MRNACHKWSKDGKQHLEFRSGKEVWEHVKDLVPVAQKTCSNYLTAEKYNWEHKQGEYFSERPTLEGLRSPVLPDPDKVMPEEEVTRISDGTRKPYKFPVRLYKKLKERVYVFKNKTGFGPRTIAPLAKLTLSEDKAWLGDDDVWEPSPAWCAWFLRDVCKLYMRRVTSKGRENGEMTDKQTELLRNLWRSTCWTVYPRLFLSAVTSSAFTSSLKTRTRMRERAPSRSSWT